MKKHQFRNLSIRNKILVYFIILILLAALLVFIPIYQKTFSMIHSYIKEQAIITVTQSSVALDNTLDSFDYMAEFLAYNSDTQDILNVTPEKPYPDFTQIPYTYSAIMERIMITNYSSLNLNRIDIFGDNGMIFEVPNSKPTYTKDEQKLIRKLASQEEGRIIWNYFRENEYSLIKEIRNITTTRPMGSLIISVKQDYLNKNLDPTFMSGKGSVLVLDIDGNFICGLPGDQSLLDALHNMTVSSSDFTKIHVGNRPLLVTSRELDSKGLILYGVIPESALYGDARLLIEWITLFIIAILLIILLCALMFANSISKPLRKMKTAMDTASSGDFSYRLPVESNDEVGSLANHFNNMQREIQDLINNVYKQELLQKEAEFQMLQAQINPHFIYNVLDSISWTARTHQMNEIADMVSSFSKLLRLSISKRTNITIREELECIQNYLFIQKIRYKDRIRAVLDVEPQLFPLVIPKLILEPLVENAIVHGLESQDGNGLIYVSGEEKNGIVTFVIKDNGVGISQDRISQIMNNKTGSEYAHTGLGMLTVHQRIQHIYGPEYGIAIDSVVGEGTKIYVRFPFHPCTDSEKEDPAC